jgi:uncharacterized delta-60 repeat protein
MKAINRSLLLLLLVSGAAAQLKAAAGALVRPTVIDGSFAPDVSGFWSYSAAVQADGKVVVVGQTQDRSSSIVVRFNQDGSRDTDFQPEPAFHAGLTNVLASHRESVSIEPDGQILVGETLMLADQTSQARVVRFRTDGSLDSDFKAWLTLSDPSLPGWNPISLLQPLPDGRVFVSGEFIAVNDLPREHAALLDSDGTPDPRFDPVWFQSAGQVSSPSCVCLCSDGKLLVGGIFDTVAGQPADNLVRFNSDGSVDQTFVTALPQDSVDALATQPDERILVAYSTYHDGNPIWSIARLLRDGSVDPTFASPPEVGVYSSIDEMNVQPNGMIIVGGQFPTPGMTSYRLLRLAANGALDFNLTEGLESERIVSNRLHPLPDDPNGRLIGLVDFTDIDQTGLNRFFSNGSIPGVQFAHAHRLVSEADHAAIIDVRRTGDISQPLSVAYTTRDGTATAGVDYIAQSGSLQFAPLEEARSFTIPILNNATLDGDKTVVLTLSAPSSGAVLGQAKAVLTIQDDEISTPQHPGSRGFQFSSSVLDVGEDAKSATMVIQRTGESSGTSSIDFTTIDGTAKAGTDYMPQAGTLRFGPLETAKSVTIPILDDYLIGTKKQFTVALTDSPPGVLLGAGPSTESIVIYDAERPGSVDFSFSPAPLALYGRVFSCAVQADGKVLAIGVFNSQTSDLLTCLQRLNPDGSLDASFEAIVCPDPTDVGPLSSVLTVVPRPDGKILIGGDFTAVNSQPRNGIALLRADGSLDQSFNAPIATGWTGGIGKLAFQHDGQTIIAGLFNGSNQVMRLKENGEVDNTFRPPSNISPKAQTLAIQADGKILLNFASDPASPHTFQLLRLNTDGALDSGFVGLTNDVVTSLAVQPNGKILVAGGLFLDQGRLSAFSNDQVVRLSPNGSLDTSFVNGLNPNDGPITGLALQSDGRILVGFDSGYSRRTHNSLARLNTDGTVDQSFDVGEGIPDPFGNAQGPGTIVVLPDGRILVSGTILFSGGSAFSQFDGVPRAGLVMLHGDPPLRFLCPLEPVPGNLTLSTLTGRSYSVEASTDLRTWMPLTTNTATGFVTPLNDPDAAHSDRRFYRAREVSIER